MWGVVVSYPRKRWSNQEDEWLSSHFPSASEEEIELHLKRTFYACKRRVYVLRKGGCLIGDRETFFHRWTEEECRNLIDLWEWGSKEELMILFSGFSMDRIKGHVSRLRERGFEIPKRRRKAKEIFTSPIDDQRCNITVNSHGYLFFYSNVEGKTERVLIHRREMEKHLGRSLVRDEMVHHKDGDRKNNHISNLMVVSRKTHNSFNARNLKLAEEFIRSKELWDEWELFLTKRGEVQ